MPVLELFALTKPEPSSAGRILAVNHDSDFRVAESLLPSKDHRQPKTSQVFGELFHPYSVISFDSSALGIAGCERHRSLAKPLARRV